MNCQTILDGPVLAFSASFVLTCNVTTAVGCGAVRALTRRLLCCQNIELSESVSLVLLHLFNQPDTRCYLRMHSDLLVLLAPITDVHYKHDVSEWENARQMSVATAARSRVHGEDSKYAVKVSWNKARKTCHC